MAGYPNAQNNPAAAIPVWLAPNAAGNSGSAPFSILGSVPPGYGTALLGFYSLSLPSVSSGQVVPLATDASGRVLTVDSGTASNSSAIQAAVAMTVATTYTAQRYIGVNCTVAGTMTIQFPDSSTMTVTLVVGWQIFHFAVTQVTAATATATYYNLK